MPFALICIANIGIYLPNLLTKFLQLADPYLPVISISNAGRKDKSKVGGRNTLSPQLGQQFENEDTSAVRPHLIQVQSNPQLAYLFGCGGINSVVYSIGSYLDSESKGTCVDYGINKNLDAKNRKAKIKPVFLTDKLILNSCSG